MINSLESFYSVPKLSSINSRGEVKVLFSSPLRELIYEEIVANFILSGQHFRRLEEVEENNEIDSAPRGNNSGSRPRILFNSPFWTGVHIKFKREAHPPFPVYNDDNDYGEGKIERAVRGYRNIENRSGSTCNCESD